MGRAPCCDKMNVKKGPWSPEEDAKLRNFIQTNGTGGNWITLPSKAGLRRCGKSCRLRWINYLRPDIKHGSFTEEEEKVIIDLHGKMGSRWSLIAAKLPGRTDNDIKNYWNTRLKKKLVERGMYPSSIQCQQQKQQQQQQQQYQQQQQQQQQGQLEQRNYHIPSGVPVFGLSMFQSGELYQPQMRAGQLIDHRTAQHWEQQRYNVAPVPNPESRPARLCTQVQQLDQLQPGPAIYRTGTSVLPPRVSDEDPRVRTIQSELMVIISPEVSDAVTSTQTSDILHQLSPNSPCHNWSPDRSYGAHLDDNPYNAFCSVSYGDPPPLVDVQSHVPLPMTSVQSPLSHNQQLPIAASSMQTENPASATPSTPSGRFGGWYGDLQALFAPDQTWFVPDSVTGSLDKILGGKEEGPTDFSSCDFMPDLISSPTTRGFSSSRTWPQRCGDGVPSDNQAQLLPSQMEYSEHFMYTAQQYVSI